MSNEPQRYEGGPARPIPPVIEGWALCTHEDDYARREAATLGALPLYHHVDRAIPSAGLYKFFKWETAAGGHTISALRWEGTQSLGSPPGTLGDAQIGTVSGDAVVVSGAVAEQAANGWTDNNGTLVPPSDVIDLLTPGDVIGGISATEYAQFKSPPGAQLYKYEPTNNAGFFVGTGVNQALLSPIPGGTSTTTTTTTTTTTGMTALEVAGGLALLLLAGGGAYYLATT